VSPPPPKTIRLTARLTDAEADALRGTWVGPDAYDVLADEDCTVLKPDGSVLFRLLRGVLPDALTRPALPVLRRAAVKTDNRGLAAGPLPLPRRPAPGINPGGRNRAGVLKRDGTLSNQTQAPEVQSGVLGYFDRTARFPYCRETAFTLGHPERWGPVLPMVRAIDELFRAHAPERYAAQRALADRTPGDFLIRGTAFTTVTVNRNFRTAVHKDVGDLAEGFGVMTAIRTGLFTGGDLVFPAFRAAARMRTGDLLLADVHEWHGNTAMEGAPGRWERVSLVLYYREQIRHCGTAAEELGRAKARRKGQPLNG
jgi:hypothetical protein